MKCEPCGKNVYRYYRTAARVALRRSLDAGPLRIYRCPHGAGWHLTSRITSAKKEAS